MARKCFSLTKVKNAIRKKCQLAQRVSAKRKTKNLKKTSNATIIYYDKLYSNHKMFVQICIPVTRHHVLILVKKIRIIKFSGRET